MESINDEWREVYMYIFKFAKNIFFLSDRNWIKSMIYAMKNITATQFMKARATIKIKKMFFSSHLTCTAKLIRTNFTYFLIEIYAKFINFI